MDGYTGSDDEWPNEFRDSCAYLGADAEVGLDVRSFTRLVDDPSDQGQHFTDTELQSLIDELLGRHHLDSA
eukprot:6637834-Alexandrium_andersonii.AAC.1